MPDQKIQEGKPPMKLSAKQSAALKTLRFEDIADLPDALVAELSKPIRDLYAAKVTKCPTAYAAGSRGSLMWRSRRYRVTLSATDRKTRPN